MNILRKLLREKPITLLMYLMIAPSVFYIIGIFIGSIWKVVLVFTLKDLINFYSSYIPSMITLALGYVIYKQNDIINKNSLNQMTEFEKMKYAPKLIIIEGGVVIQDINCYECNMDAKFSMHDIIVGFEPHVSFTEIKNQGGARGALCFHANVVNTSEVDITAMRINMRTTIENDIYLGAFSNFKTIKKNDSASIPMMVYSSKESCLIKRINQEKAVFNIILDFHMFSSDNGMSNEMSSMIEVSTRMDVEKKTIKSTVHKIHNSVGKKFFEVYFGENNTKEPLILFKGESEQKIKSQIGNRYKE